MDRVRSAIRAEVAGIAPLDTMEQRDIAGVLDWIDSGLPLCRVKKPATPPQHLVSYFAVVDGDHILLVDHINAGLWLPPGGHVEPDELPRDTVIREAQEELGLAAAFLTEGPLFLTVAPTVGLTPGHIDVSLWYVLAARLNEALTFDRGEFHAIRWFAKGDVPLGRSDPHLARFLEKLAQANL